MAEVDDTIKHNERVVIQIILVTNTLSALGATLMILTYFKTINICISNCAFSKYI
ncbi:unnamed protein product [Paramecium sonneborni]|uniref:Uncharacterized protein n=1 Tax=Paramecium sonneborni TaxID=65129 RepID=A0A8S1PMM3_9CILI|nr:unnamed protein product [Paramecium sonneborni]